MAVTIYHRVHNRVRIVNKKKEPEDIVASFQSRKHARRVVKDVRK